MTYAFRVALPRERVAVAIRGPRMTGCRLSQGTLVLGRSKSVKEVAEIIGIAEATVRTRMFYARKKLPRWSRPRS
jgi:hypothetical protein